MPEVKILDVMLSKATTGMLIAELLQRKDDKDQPLFMGNSIMLSNAQLQLLGILPNVQVLTTVEEEEWYIYLDVGVLNT